MYDPEFRLTVTVTFTIIFGDDVQLYFTVSIMKADASCYVDPVEYIDCFCLGSLPPVMPRILEQYPLIRFWNTLVQLGEI